MPSPANQKLSAYLFMASGVASFVAGVVGKEPALYAIGAAFIAIGAIFLGKRKRNE